MVESKLQTDEENLNEFNADRWVRQVQFLSQNPDKLDIDTWVGMLYETTNLFKKMGSAMSMAFSGTLIFIHFNNWEFICDIDVTSKAAIIADNKKFYEKEFG